MCKTCLSIDLSYRITHKMKCNKSCQGAMTQKYFTSKWTIHNLSNCNKWQSNLCSISLVSMSANHIGILQITQQSTKISWMPRKITRLHQRWNFESLFWLECYHLLFRWSDVIKKEKKSERSGCPSRISCLLPQPWKELGV